MKKSPGKQRGCWVPLKDFNRVVKERDAAKKRVAEHEFRWLKMRERITELEVALEMSPCACRIGSVLAGGDTDYRCPRCAALREVKP